MTALSSPPPYAFVLASVPDGLISMYLSSNSRYVPSPTNLIDYKLSKLRLLKESFKTSLTFSMVMMPSLTAIAIER